MWLWHHSAAAGMFIVFYEVNCSHKLFRLFFSYKEKYWKHHSAATDTFVLKLMTVKNEYFFIKKKILKKSRN